MCGIKTTFMITQGCVAFSMEKNSSHLKNFTLTSLLALVTIMRYDDNRDNNSDDNHDDQGAN